MSTPLNDLAAKCHAASIKWWLDLQQPCCACMGKPLEIQAQCDYCNGYGYALKNRDVGNLLMLCVSELSEAMEGHRKDLMDDKLPHRKMFEVELADCLIRIFDMAGAYNLDLDGALGEKMGYNAVRKDHKIEERLKAGGKKY